MINFLFEFYPPWPSNSSRCLVSLAIACMVIMVSSKRLIAQGSGVAVQGKVVDEAGAPMPGVNVMEKETVNGTITDVDGSFSMRVNGSNSILTFSFIGYLPREVRVGERTSVSVTMAPDVKNLDEVVVVGYGTQKKVTLTGAISSIKGEQITTTKNESILNTLSGKLPGVIVVQNTAEPGSYNNNFNIRGLGSPLIVIDGIAQENADTFYRLNPNDIETISVLKDASAAVYGFRSANGVVLVTTKQGKGGKFTLDYIGTYGVQRQSGVAPTLNAVDYMTLRNEFSVHSDLAGKKIYSEEEIEAYRSGKKKGTDWIGLTMRENAPQSQHTISASCGTDRINFYSGLGYLYQGGLFKNNSISYDRFSLTTNITAKLSKSFKATLNLEGITDKKQNPFVDVGTFFGVVWNMNSMQTPFLTETEQYPTQSWFDNSLNPYIIMNPDYVGYKKYEKKYLNSLFTLTYDAPFLPGLQFSVTGSYNYRTHNNNFFQKQYNVYRDTTAYYLAHPTTLQSPSQVSRELYEFTNLTARVKAEYKETFNGHTIDVLLLTEQLERKGDNFSARRNLILPVPLLSAGLDSDQLAAMNDGDEQTPYPYEFINRALIGRVAYDYKTKYIADYSFRYDGSSRFISSNQWGLFHSASAGWRISEESFFKNSGFLSFVDNLKLRAGYGVLGDDGAATYQFTTGYNYPANKNTSPGGIPAGAVFDGKFVPSSQNRGIANPKLTWYTSKTLNAGIDYSMWREKLGITFEFFVRNRSGLLTTRAGSLPGVTGASLPQENLNSDRTHGFELALSHHSVWGKFTLDATLNMSYTRTYNKVRGDQAPRTNSYDNWRNNSNDRVSDVKFLSQYAGQYQSWGEIYNSPFFVGNNTVPGDYYFNDYSGNGQQGSDSYTYNQAPFLLNAGGRFPLMNFGSTIGLRYKIFDLSLVWQAATLRHTQVPMDFTRFSVGSPYGSAITDFLDRWRPADPDANPFDPNTVWVPGKYAYTGTPVPDNSTLAYKDASYIRLKSLEFGYSLPSVWVKKAGLQNARFFFNAYNLLTFSYVGKYLDPERPGRDKDNSGYAYPLNKVFNSGVDVKF